jgi:hypothetical protein
VPQVVRCRVSVAIGAVLLGCDILTGVRCETRRFRSLRLRQDWEKSKDPSPAAKRRDLSPQERGEVYWRLSTSATHRSAKEKDQPNLAPLLRGEVAALRRG